MASKFLTSRYHRNCRTYIEAVLHSEFSSIFPESLIVSHYYSQRACSSSFDRNDQPMSSKLVKFMEETQESKFSSESTCDSAAGNVLGNTQGEFSDQSSLVPVQSDASLAEIAKCIALFLNVSIWESLAEALLKQKKVKLTPYLVSEVLWQQKDIDKALGFFRWTIGRKGLTSDPRTHIVMITQLEKAKRHVEIWQLIEDMPNKLLGSSALTVTKIMDCFATTESISEAVNGFKSIRSSGSAPSSLSYSCFLGLLLKIGQVDEAIPLCMMAVMEGSIDADSCNILIDSLAKLNRSDISCKLFHRMRRGCCKPNLVTYNLLINYLGKSRKVLEACNIFHLVKRDGLKPDATLYLSLINILGKNGKVNLAHQYFKDLKLLVGKPSAVAYACMIDSYGRAGKEIQALKMYDEMKENEVHPDVVVYNTLFRVLGRARNAIAANRLLGEMRYKKCEPDLQTYNQMIDCFGRNGWIQKAFDIFGEMRRQGMLPDTVTYCILINSLGSKGEAPKAFELFKEMVSEGFHPNVITYNSMIKALARTNFYEQAFQLYEQMPRHGCQPDAITFSILLDMCTAHCDAKRSVRLYNDLKAADVTPDKAMKKIIFRSMQFLQQESHLYSQNCGRNAMCQFETA
ncbi:hypothetical protein O6H91_05G006500 [Diphasiastrum complanatum]|uniref:Uncharacterized protein n=1 Tax=Diphasiastrum complanatum TaxID=34168 RepID=A0ACC2DKA3_DIPCM|nr:hypothetical protein O6H91_05G006500 [Diphasiastrum complanatum]